MSLGAFALSTQQPVFGEGRDGLSFEVYLQCFDSGGPAGVPREAVRRLFPVVAAQSEPDYWHVRYDDLNSCSISIGALGTDPGVLESICVHRPCSDIRLWDALLEVMRLGHVALYFPGNSPPLVASEEAGAHLPRDMVEALGPPRTVRSGREINEIVEND